MVIIYYILLLLHGLDVTPIIYMIWNFIKLISRTGYQCDTVFSVDDFPVVFGARDIRQVVRRRASPPAGQTVGAAHDYRQHEPPPPGPVVDLVTGTCKRGIVSRPAFTSPLTLDLTAMCTSGVKVLPPGASTQVVLPPATMASTVTAVGTIRYDTIYLFNKKHI